MIRRLPFEEVTPPSQAIAPIGQSGKSQDDPESESLAIEFKALLEQISGGMASLSDQAMAIGIALAQAAPLERAVQRDLQKVEKTDDSGDFGEEGDLLDERDSGDQNGSIKLDNGDNGKRLESRASDSDAGVKNEGEQVEVETGPVAVADAVEVAEVATMDSGDEVSTLLSLVSQDLGDESAQDLSMVTTQKVSDGPVEVAFQETEVVVEQEQVALTNAQNFVASEVKTKVQQKSDDEGEEEVEELIDPAALGAAQIASDGEDTRRNLAANGKNRAQEGDKDFTPQAQHSEVARQSANQDLKARADLNRLRENTGNAFALGQRREGESTQKAGKSKEGGISVEAEVVAPSVTKMVNRSSEGAIQMTLLRQAFESLKAARQDLADGRAKSAAPTVSGVQAPTETKNASSDTASRSSRGMTKPQTARMLERVEASLKEAARARDGKTISLRLDPANLGRVKVDVSLRDGSLHARISPENQQVMIALRENAHDLQGALRKLGLNVDSVSVTVTSELAKEETTTGQQTMDGRSFQEERNNMPREKGQVVENRSGNELAEWKGVRTPEQTGAVLDHWVA